LVDHLGISKGDLDKMKKIRKGSSFFLTYECHGDSPILPFFHCILEVCKRLEMCDKGRNSFLVYVCVYVVVKMEEKAWGVCFCIWL
jgi:hypothetical protein